MLMNNFLQRRMLKMVTQFLRGHRPSPPVRVIHMRLLYTDARAFWTGFITAIRAAIRSQPISTQVQTAPLIGRLATVLIPKILLPSLCDSSDVFFSTVTIYYKEKVTSDAILL